MPIVLSESSDRLTPSPSARDLAASTEAAKLAGCPVYYIEADFSRCGDAEAALAHVPVQDSVRTGIWIGYIPDLARYHAIHTAALAKGIRLINSPVEHQRAQEFDLAYPFIRPFTARSVIIREVSECLAAGRELGYPVFVKGTVQSRKAKGWSACVAGDPAELTTLAQRLLSLDARTRGRVIVRELVPLRHHRKANDFPLGREYRVFLCQNEIIGLGYYWEGEDAYKALTPSEERAVSELAKSAAEALRVPYLAIDIGQKESGEWLVIETGDGQFSGFSQVDRLRLWARMARL
jgi:hypothetical protein